MGLEQGRYRFFYTSSPLQVARAQALRARCFGLSCAADIDNFDEQCTHLLIEDRGSGDLVACCRTLNISGQGALSAYAAQFYDLRLLADRQNQMLEIGRFCVAPGRQAPEILRLAWAALARQVENDAVDLLFGCTSFRGMDPAAYVDAFALLGARYLAPRGISPGVKSTDAIPLPLVAGAPPATRLAMGQMPPLLRFYLAMGARVGNHVVPDPVLNTLHIFTVLDVVSMSPAHGRFLRAI